MVGGGVGVMVDGGVGVIVGVSTEEVLVVAGSATQRTWPTVMFQFAFRVGFQEYNCAFVMLNFVQIK